MHQEVTKFIMEIPGQAPTKEQAITAEGDEGGPTRRQVAMAVVAFAFFSTCLLAANQVAVHHLPSPGLLVFAQLLTAATTAQLLDDWGVVKSDDMEWAKVRPFIPVALTSALTIFTSVKVLTSANAKTFMVLRCAALIPVTILDYIFLGTEAPTFQSLASMACMVAGVIRYVAADGASALKGSFWAFAWLLVFIVDQVYIKHVVERVPMTTWGRVFHSSILSIPAVAVLGLLLDDRAEVVANITTTSLSLLLISCALGVGMSFSSYHLRKMVSATTFTVVGTLCKIGMVVAHIFFVSGEHVSHGGRAGLMLALVAGFFYRQAPMRAPQTAICRWMPLSTQTTSDLSGRIRP